MLRSLLSGDTRQESQNRSVTETYSVGLNHDAELSYKNDAKRSSHPRDNLCEKSSNQIG